MTDTIEFEIALKRAGLTKKKVAQSLGISEMGLYQKVNNITEFKATTTPSAETGGIRATERR